MIDINILLSKLDTLAANPVDYNLMLDVTILMYQENCVCDGKIDLCKKIKNDANTRLQYAKYFIDIFIEINVFYVDNKKSTHINNMNMFRPYYTRKIIKEYFKINDLYYIINNNLDYYTYQKMHRKEKLDEIFGNSLIGKMI
jgi:hypothetical protein